MSENGGVPIAVTQFCATEDKAHNFAVCADLIKKSAKDEAKVRASTFLLLKCAAS